MNEIETVKKSKKRIAELKAEMEVAEIAAVTDVTGRTEALDSNIDNISDSGKQALIAEAYRFTGRVEGLNFVQKVVTVTTLVTLKTIKESKVYKNIAGCETWEKYCLSIGYSREKIDKDLDNLKTFGEEFLVSVTSFGLGYRDLRKLSKLKDSGSIAIENNQFIVEGEVIAIDDKERLREALESVIEAKNDVIKEKERMITAKDELNKLISKQREEAREEANANKRQIDNFVLGRNYDIEKDELPDFKELKLIEDRITAISIDLHKLSNRELSEINQHLLGGVVLLGFKMLEDVRLTINNKAGVYLDRLSMTDKEIEASDKMLLPSRYKK